MSNSRVFAETKELQYSTEISSSETDTASDINEIESEELKYSLFIILNWYVFRSLYSKRQGAKSI